MVGIEKLNFSDVKNYMKTHMSKPVDWNSENEYVKNELVKPVIYITYNPIEHEVYSNNNHRTQSIIFRNNELISNTKWYIMSGGKTNGPYYTREILGKIKMGAIDELTQIKRETDRRFLPFQDIKSNISNFDVLDELYSNESGKIVQEKIPLSIKLQNCRETNKFLALNRSEIDINEIVRYIKGKSYVEAIMVLNKYTNMGEIKNKRVLTLLGKEFDEKILKK